ncbi:MAG: FMN-binding protein [Candidatus Omnitrophica bacterium]|nr:FMN-binding protein [Candidatus Omnitrophota bacterium]
MENKALTDIFTGPEKVHPKLGSPPRYDIYQTRPDNPEVLAAVAFNTYDITPRIKGYAGPVKLLVAISTDGTIKDVRVLKHSETPSYVFTLDEFMAQFKGKNIADSFQLGKDIDGITRATMTSEAVARSVDKGAKAIGRQILELDVGGPSGDRPKTLSYIHIIVPLMLFIVAVGGVLGRNTFLRGLALLTGFVYLGLIKSTMVSVVQLVNIGMLKFPDFVTNPLWYCLVVMTLLSSVILGMVYCGSICPFAGVQEVLFHLGRKLKWEELKFSHKVAGQARYVKFGILFVVLAASFIIGNSSAANVEVFLILFAAHASQAGWAFVVFILTLSVFHFRFWCKFLCPIGAFNGLLADKSIYKIQFGPECGGCGVCDKVCPVGAIQMVDDKPLIDYPECTLCNKCVEKCPKEILFLTRNRQQGLTKHD